MKRKPKLGRRVDQTGRSIGGAQHVRLYRWELESPAYQFLSLGARALLIELKALYNGSNNGTLFLSIREAARRLDCSKTVASVFFAELQECGFIRPSAKGHFNMKAEARRGTATSWILTEFPIGEAKGAGSRDFMRWKPSPQQLEERAQRKAKRARKAPAPRAKRAENHLTVRRGEHSVSPHGTVPEKPRLSVLRGGTLSDEIVAQRSHVVGHR